jgi:RES domain-containing protein
MRLPPHFVFFELEIPEGLTVRQLRIEDLPADARRQLGPPALREIGTHWVHPGESGVLELPSAVVPGEHNFLLNLRHPDFARLAIGDPEPFAFDEGLIVTHPGCGA